MKYIKVTFFTFFFSCIFLPAYSFATTDKPVLNKAEEQKINEERIKEECAKSPQACKLETTLTEIETEVQDLAGKYRNQSIWDEPTHVYGEEKYNKAFPLLEYGLKVPSYIIRFGTWPVALIGDYAIKKGVARKVINVISNKDRTIWVYPKIEMGFGSGFGGGIGFRNSNVSHKNYNLSGYYLIHINLNQKATVTLEKPDAFYFKGKPFSYKLYVDFIRLYDIGFYGIGIETPRSGLVTYSVDDSHIGGYFGYEALKNLTARFHTYFLLEAPKRGYTGNNISNTYPQSMLIAFNDSLYYEVFGLSLTHDNRDTNVSPEKGGLRLAVFSRYQGLTTTKYDYNQYHMEASQFFRVLMPRYVFALRASWTYQQQTGETIPFYRQARLDVLSPARGFDFGRFTDRGMAVINVEFHHPVWKFLDGEFFFDMGRVFHKPTDFSFKHFKYSGGGGLRFRTKNYFLLRAEIAYGGEGVKFLFKTAQAF